MPCFYRFEHFACVPIYIFGFHHQQCASNQDDFSFVKFTTQMFGSADESLQNETLVLLVQVSLLLTPHTFVFIYITSVVKPVHIFMARSRYSKSRSKAELCHYGFEHFTCVPIYIFGFHHKQCACDQKDFTFVKFTSQMFGSADEPLKDETRLLLL